TSCAINISLAQRTLEPNLCDVFARVRIFSKNRLHRGVQRARISAPVEFYGRTIRSHVCSFGINRDCAIQNTLGICITAQADVTVGELLEETTVLRIELDSALE